VDRGTRRFDDGAARQVDAATAHAQGSFSKWTANFFRLQSLSARDALYLTLSGQWANSNLDPAEKMVAGGPYTVRPMISARNPATPAYWAVPNSGTSWFRL